MRICILTHTFPRFKGDKISSIFMAELAQSLVDSGSKVYVLTPFTPLLKKSKLDYSVITYKYIFPDFLHKLGYSETLTNDMGLPLIMWLLSPFMYFFGLLALINLIKKEKIEVINAHWILPNGFIACLAAFFTGTPIISTLPGSDVYMAKKNMLFNIMARFATRNSTWITSNSGQLISDLEKATDVVLENKSSIIVYGIGSDKFKPDTQAGQKTRKLMGYISKDVVVLGVGRLVAKKGFEYLLKAMPKVIKENRNIFLVLIGDGEQRKYLEDLTRGLQISKNIKFLGNISYTQMNNYYNMADIFILPSIRDEQGNLDDQSVAVMDAMSCGKPVITTNFPGYRLVISNGINGFLTQEKDINEITQKVILLANSKSLRDRMGKTARKTILEKFSWEAIGGQYSQLFKNIYLK